ncbi:hypothetical protein ACH5RR_027003 [Cinchona calisaya]|uniref:Uncharacterized protein n=1 Tax=Cinchona calisaya TaxID=153742 RepID=A0ABD2Z634_9GENT
MQCCRLVGTKLCIPSPLAEEELLLLIHGDSCSSAPKEGDASAPKEGDACIQLQKKLLRQIEPFGQGDTHPSAPKSASDAHIVIDINPSAQKSAVDAHIVIDISGSSSGFT